MLTGMFSLVVTPFRDDLSLDEQGLRTHVRRQVESRITGIAPLGVTGESPLLSEKELVRVVEIIAEEAKGRCLIAPETCSCSLDQTIQRAKLYASLGCDYAVVFAPYLVKPTSAGILDFYERVADASPIPVLLHNTPERVGVTVDPKMYARLMAHPNIVGSKDGMKEMDHLAKILYLARGSSFALFTGKDTTAYPLMSFGGQGSFSVAANVIPEVMRDLFDFCRRGEWDKARALHYDYYELFAALRLETNPMAVKEALLLMGLPGGGLRPPLTRLSEPNREILKKLLKDKGLI